MDVSNCDTIIRMNLILKDMCNLQKKMKSRNNLFIKITCHYSMLSCLFPTIFSYHSEEKGLSQYIYCMFWRSCSNFSTWPLRESVQIRSFFWFVFSCIRSKYGDLHRIPLYSVRIQENKKKKKLCIRTLSLSGF